MRAKLSLTLEKDINIKNEEEIAIVVKSVSLSRDTATGAFKDILELVVSSDLSDLIDDTFNALNAEELEVIAELEKRITRNNDAKKKKEENGVKKQAKKGGPGKKSKT